MWSMIEPLQAATSKSDYQNLRLLSKESPPHLAKWVP